MKFKEYLESRNISYKKLSNSDTPDINVDLSNWLLLTDNKNFHSPEWMRTLPEVIQTRPKIISKKSNTIQSVDFYSLCKNCEPTDIEVQAFAQMRDVDTSVAKNYALSYNTKIYEYIKGLEWHKSLQNSISKIVSISSIISGFLIVYKFRKKSILKQSLGFFIGSVITNITFNTGAEYLIRRPSILKYGTIVNSLRKHIKSGET